MEGEIYQQGSFPMDVYVKSRTMRSQKYDTYIASQEFLLPQYLLIRIKFNIERRHSLIMRCLIGWLSKASIARVRELYEK
jgi:hypothetical protein